MSEPVLPGAELPPPGPEEPAVPVRKSSWPDVLGIIGIILGALGIFGNLGNVFYPISRFFLGQIAIHSPTPGLFHTMLGFMPPAAIVMLTGLVKVALSLLLLVGSIQLKNRRRQGAGLLKTWAIIKIPWTVLEMGLAFVIVRAILPGLPHLRSYDVPVEFAVWSGMLIGLLIALSVPVFVLVWFYSPSIANEVDSWES
jgi:hypothetical protein